MNKKLLLIIGCIVLVITGCISKKNQHVGNVENNKKSAETAKLDKAPNFSLKDYNGKTVSLSDFAGKPVVINSWAAWCPFCKKELPDFAAAQKEFGEQVVIIAIDRAESLATSKKYSDEVGATDDLIFLLDPKDSFYQSIGGFSMPETIFVDQDGFIREHKRGPMELAEIREKIDSLLEP